MKVFFGDVGKIKTQVQTGEFKNPFSIEQGNRSIFGGYELHIDPNAAIGDFINAIKSGAAAIDTATGAVGNGAQPTYARLFAERCRPGGERRRPRPGSASALGAENAAAATIPIPGAVVPEQL